MPKQKDLKRLVRTRMKKTGESYTAARAQFTRKRVSQTPGTDYATLAGMSDAAVRAKTGKTWAQWVRALDAIDAYTLPHPDIAAHVKSAYAIGAWWSQAVTVGYERIHGLREKGQRRDGAYEVNRTRTLAASPEALHRAFADARMRRTWLGDATSRVRTSTPPESVRLTWPDGTIVDVVVIDKGAKAQVNVQHRKLQTKAQAERLRTWWGERLDALATLLKT